MTKIAVITGASGGLGKSLTKEFVAKGWQVIGTGRSEQPSDLPDGVTYRQFDASEAKASESFWQELKQANPDAEICLVNNAGGYVSGGLTEVKPEDYDLQMRSSYFTAVYMTRGLAVNFPRARIVNIISSSALTAYKDDSAYGAAKAAAKHFFQSLQEEFSPKQYQITNLYPSDIATHGADTKAIDPEDLAVFVRQQAENDSSHYLRDATVYPSS
ncbi:MAG TPA: SDR family oxidoreductase [Candidatus Saccharimonadales bacterium]|nr:SDR family oxidoreductase [Candidatus Saccharimonadales bacterium]